MIIKCSFVAFSKLSARLMGAPGTFLLALAVVIVWAASGYFFNFSDTWQMVINTGTTIVTFLMVFIIQNTQNRDTEAMQLKLDELIRSTEGAHLALLDLEELSEKELDLIRARYIKLARKSRDELCKGVPDTGRPEAE